MLVVAQNLHNRVVIFHVTPRSSLSRALLSNLLAVPNDDTLVLRGAREKFAAVADGYAPDPVGMTVRQR